MAKRKASFIGTPAWVDRDVFVEDDENGILTIADVPSGINIAFRTPILLADALAKLAHRVKQIGL